MELNRINNSSHDTDILSGFCFGEKLIQQKISGFGYVDGMYICDYNIIRLGDIVKSIYLDSNANNFIKAEFLVGGIVQSILTDYYSLYSRFNNSLQFFEGNFDLVAIPYSSYTVRLYFDKNCVQHVKLYTLYKHLKDDERRERARGDVELKVSIISFPTDKICRTTPCKEGITLTNEGRQGVLVSTYKPSSFTYHPTYIQKDKTKVYDLNVKYRLCGIMVKGVPFNGTVSARLISDGYLLSAINIDGQYLFFFHDYEKSDQGCYYPLKIDFGKANCSNITLEIDYDKDIEVTAHFDTEKDDRDHIRVNHPLKELRNISKEGTECTFEKEKYLLFRDSTLSIRQQ